MELLHPSNLVAWAFQAGMVVLVAAPLPRLLGMWSPRARMTYWRVVLVTCLLLPLLQTWTVREAVVSVLEPAFSVDVVGEAGGPVVPASSFTEIVSATASRPILGPIGVAQVLVAGVLLRLAWLGLGVFTVGRLRRSARRLWPRPPSVDRAATLAETDAEFLVSATASRPVTCGWAWPVVLVPRTFESFPEHEQTAIATHELLHVSRADWARNAADEVLRALLWFHPGIWYAINQIQLAREQVVDREAVRRLGTRQPYLEALLRLAKPAPRLVLTPASLFLKRAHLRQRVTLLVKEVSMSRARLAGSLAVMAVVVFLGGRIATAAFPLQQSGAKTPGVATGEPKLNLGTTPLTFKFTEGISVRQVITFWAQATGVTVTYDRGTEQALNGNIGPIDAKDVTATQALSQILAAARLTYRVTGERAIAIGSGGGPVGGAGAARPGVSTGAGGGVAGGVGSAVPGGVAGGVAGGTRGGVAGGVSGGVAGGAAGGTGSAPMTDERFLQILANIRRAQGLDTEEKFQAALKAEGMTVADLRAAIERVGQTGTTAGLPTFMTSAGTVSSQQVAAGDMNFGVVRRADPTAPGASGRCLVTVAVNADGSVGDVRSTHASGGEPLDAGLAEAAAAAAKSWQFEPGPQEFRGALIGFNFTPENTNGAVDSAAVRIGGNIKPPIKTRDVKPIYPKEAQESRLQGVQILEISLSPSGHVLDARALRAQLPLISAAMDAVLRWEFTPWDGPERRLMTVTVNFTLADGPANLGMPVRDQPPGNPATPTPTNWPANALRVGGNIKPPSRIVDAKAVYPKEAQEAKVQGVVILEVLIGEDGTVKDEHVLRSIPMLDKAAEEAVRQWEFTPTLLNGNAIPLIMTVTVNFTLG